MDRTNRPIAVLAMRADLPERLFDMDARNA